MSNLVKNFMYYIARGVHNTASAHIFDLVKSFMHYIDSGVHSTASAHTFRVNDGVKTSVGK